MATLTILVFIVGILLGLDGLFKIQVLRINKYPNTSQGLYFRSYLTIWIVSALAISVGIFFDLDGEVLLLQIFSFVNLGLASLLQLKAWEYNKLKLNNWLGARRARRYWPGTHLTAPQPQKSNSIPLSSVKEFVSTVATFLGIIASILGIISFYWEKL